jgi:carbon storage regulator
MLVLSRREGERIIMPDQDVIVTIVAIRGNRVRIGVTAPAGVSVYREEICGARYANAGTAAESTLLRDS